MRPRGILVAAFVAALAACGSASPKPAASPGSTTTVAPAGTSMSTVPTPTVPPSTDRAGRATTTSTAAKPSVVTVSDSDGAVTVRRGDTLRVVLRSTYWTFGSPSNPGVLGPQGTPVVAGTLPCIPGGGCGTVTAVFVARAPGRSTVPATRTSCGEARACTGSSGSYALTVTII